MEQIQEEMRNNQGKKNALANIRAIERQRKMPQNLQSTELEPSHKMRGGNAAGLARVVGAGKRRARSPSSDSYSSDSSMEGGAKHMGRMMYAHLAKVHGEGYARKFMSGGAAPRNLPPMGVEVLHNRMSPASAGLPGSGLGGQDVPPNGLAPMAYGSAPQAPASFQRNSVDVGSAGLLPAPNAQVGSGKRRAKHSAPSVHSTLNMEMEGSGKRGGKAARPVAGIVYNSPEPPAMKGGARAARGAAISKLMKEKGMSLPEASKYLKENGMK